MVIFLLKKQCMKSKLFLTLYFNPELSGFGCLTSKKTLVKQHPCVNKKLTRNFTICLQASVRAKYLHLLPVQFIQIYASSRKSRKTEKKSQDITNLYLQQFCLLLSSQDPEHLCRALFVTLHSLQENETLVLLVLTSK